MLHMHLTLLCSLESDGRDPDSFGEQRALPLHIAVFNGSLTIGQTELLHVAVFNGSLTIALGRFVRAWTNQVPLILI
jgi:hypothetical protein